MDDSASIRILNELIAALDHRLPQVQRAGEAAIARDAAALKARALDRISALTRSRSDEGDADDPFLKFPAQTSRRTLLK